MLYYQLRNGNIVSEYDVQKAFEICTGEIFHYESKEYSQWLFSLLGNSIVKAMNEVDVDITQFLKGNNIIAAVRLYRNQYGCRLAEAKEAVEKIRAEMNMSSIHKLIKEGRITKAVNLYFTTYNCTFAEAKQAVDEIKTEMRC